MSEPTETAPWKAGVQAVQDSQRVVLPKRFYQDVAAGARDGGFAVLLDGRPVRTPAKKPLRVPTEALGNALAAEWQAQVIVIDPATMPMTRLVNSALDGVAGRESDVAGEIVRYVGGDLLFYRAEAPVALVERQAQHWDPIIGWAEAWASCKFIVAAGIMPVRQPLASLDRIAATISGLAPLPLAALNVMTTLTGSALLALAHAHGQITAEQAWISAHVDEDHQMTMWGRDHEAEQRRDNRWRDMQAASQLWALSAV